jgi:hypothetical protein
MPADAQAVELFAQARAGDAGAVAQVQAMIRDRKWADWIGDIGKEATHQLIARAVGDDPVWKTGIAEKVGYEIRTAVRFAERGGVPVRTTARLVEAGDQLATVTYGRAATLWRINMGWRQRANRS